MLPFHKRVMVVSSNLCKTLSCKLENCKYGKNPTTSFAKHMQKVCMISFKTIDFFLLFNVSFLRFELANFRQNHEETFRRGIVMILFQH